MLPEAASWFATAMGTAAGRSSKGGRLIALVGGTGGVGCSTLAAGLAIVAARTGRRTLLLDCDPLGGGIDLLIGAERVEGWRWPQFATVTGEIGDLWGQLPQVDDLDLLSMARSSTMRGDSSPPDPGPEQMESVLSSVGRCYDLVVADLPRTLGDGSAEVIRRAHHVVLVVPATVRGIAASRRLSSDLTALGALPVVLVRQPRSRGIASEAVSNAVGLPMVGVIADEPGLRLGAERGDPPGRSA